MSYYIIVKATGLIMSDGPNRTRAYRTESAAKATITRLIKKAGWTGDEFAITPVRDYQPRMVTRRNLMSGKEYQEDVNTPNFCSPASESYWSM